MGNINVTQDMTLLEITDKYPAAADFLVRNGIELAGDKTKLRTVGRIMKLSTALKSANLDVDTFVKNLNETLNHDFGKADITLREKSETGDLSVAGLLPCPVRLPLLEAFDQFSESFQEQTGKTFKADLRAASGGAAFLEDSINGAETIDDMNDIVLSAGFELFFGSKNLLKFLDQKAFADVTPDELNSTFDGLGIKDPMGAFSMIAAVPAVFMVNLSDLGDRKKPTSWADILSDEFEQSVSLPVGDFDLFNAILITIYKEFGEEGVRKLGKVMRDPNHPAVSMKSKDKAAVTVIPYFFSKMAKMATDLEIVWPEDGAVLSPIFMLVKDNETAKKASEIFTSYETAEILSHRGLFPATYKDIDNNLPEGAKFIWPGWEFVHENDITEMIKLTEEIFNKASQASYEENEVEA